MSSSSTGGGGRNNNNNNRERYHGIVTLIKPEQNFGFLALYGHSSEVDGTNIFFHFTQLRGGDPIPITTEEPLQVGDGFDFYLHKEADGRFKATDCKRTVLAAANPIAPPAPRPPMGASSSSSRKSTPRPPSSAANNVITATPLIGITGIVDRSKNKNRHVFVRDGENGEDDEIFFDVRQDVVPATPKIRNGDRVRADVRVMGDGTRRTGNVSLVQPVLEIVRTSVDPITSWVKQLGMPDRKVGMVTAAKDSYCFLRGLGEHIGTANAPASLLYFLSFSEIVDPPSDLQPGDILSFQLKPGSTTSAASSDSKQQASNTPPPPPPPKEHFNLAAASALVIARATDKGGDLILARGMTGQVKDVRTILYEFNSVPVESKDLLDRLKEAYQTTTSGDEIELDNLTMVEKNILCPLYCRGLRLSMKNKNDHVIVVKRPATTPAASVVQERNDDEEGEENNDDALPSSSPQPPPTPRRTLPMHILSGGSPPGDKLARGDTVMFDICIDRDTGERRAFNVRVTARAVDAKTRNSVTLTGIVASWVTSTGIGTIICLTRDQTVTFQRSHCDDTYTNPKPGDMVRFLYQESTKQESKRGSGGGGAGAKAHQFATAIRLVTDDADTCDPYKDLIWDNIPVRMVGVIGRAGHPFVDKHRIHPTALEYKQANTQSASCGLVGIGPNAKTTLYEFFQHIGGGNGTDEDGDEPLASSTLDWRKENDVVKAVKAAITGMVQDNHDAVFFPTESQDEYQTVKKAGTKAGVLVGDREPDGRVLLTNSKQLLTSRTKWIGQAVSLMTTTTTESTGSDGVVEDVGVENGITMLKIKCGETSTSVMEKDVRLVRAVKSIVPSLRKALWEWAARECTFKSPDNKLMVESTSYGLYFHAENNSEEMLKAVVDASLESCLLHHQDETGVKVYGNGPRYVSSSEKVKFDPNWNLALAFWQPHPTDDNNVMLVEGDTVEFRPVRSFGTSFLKALDMKFIRANSKREAGVIEKSWMGGTIRVQNGGGMISFAAGASVDSKTQLEVGDDVDFVRSSGGGEVVSARRIRILKKAPKTTPVTARSSSAEPSSQTSSAAVSTTTTTAVVPTRQKLNQGMEANIPAIMALGPTESSKEGFTFDLWRGLRGVAPLPSPSPPPITEQQEEETPG